MEPQAELLSVRGLRVAFPDGHGGMFAVVDDVSFDVRGGEIVGLVGESGSGKSMTLLSVLGTVPKPGTVTADSMSFDGLDLMNLPSGERRRLRGERIALIPADALGALNPVLRVSEQSADVILDHDATSDRSVATARVLDGLREVSLPDPEVRLRSFPHELSGGMQQRVVIATGLLLTPRLLLADEPTTALDATIQAQVLRLLESIRSSRGVSIVLVSHDLSTVASISDRVLVMYAARIVEEGPAADVLLHPAHPYSHALLAGAPSIDGPIPAELPTIPGAPPDLRSIDEGCRFRPRCWLYQALGQPDDCETTEPTLTPVSAGRASACHHIRDLPKQSDRLAEPAPTRSP